MGFYGTAYFENDVFADVKASMKDLLESGIAPSIAAASVLENYDCELDDEDDAAYVHMAIAAAQLEHGRLLKKAKSAAIESIDARIAQLKEDGEDKDFAMPHIESLNVFRDQLVREIKPVKAKRIPVKCKWKNGDTYALLMDGPECREIGFDGHYLLLRMVDRIVIGKDVYPFVYMSVTPEKRLPKTAQEVAEAKYLRCDFRRTYRTALFYKSDEVLEEFGLIYVGCFPDIPAPEVEVVMEGWYKEFCFSRGPLLDIVQKACNSYKTYGFECDSYKQKTK